MSLHRAVVFAFLFVYGALILCPPSHAATVGTISVHSSTTGVVQNNGSINIVVIRTGGSTGVASVKCSTANGTAVSGKDYTSVATTLQWANGDAAPKNCTVAVSEAVPFSGQKNFTVQLSGASGATLGASTKNTVTIYGNKGGGTVAVAASAYSVAQSAGNVAITVNRTGGTIGTAVVSYATANSTAVAGKDFTAESGMLSWANGDATPRVVNVPISKVTAFAGTKTLAFALAHAENVVMGTPTSTIVTISGTTTAKPTVSLAASPTSVASGASSTLNWSVTNATSCTGSGAWSGAMAMSGTKSTGALTAGSIYTLTCSGSGGTTLQSITVAVNAPAGLPSAPAGVACTGTNGALTLKASVTRSSGVSPLMVFFDATGTTDTSVKANASAFQDVHYTWAFGDTGTSGTGTWSHGSNPGHNSKNSASGGVAAHLYMTAGADKVYTATVTADDGTNKATCQLGVTAYDPAGANGFPGANTTCVSASGTPTPGAGGCPGGAAVLSTNSVATALGSTHLANGKRVLFKCGDTFAAHQAFIGAVTKWTVGAYGGCENTQTNRPIFSFSGAHDGSVILLLGIGSNVPGDGRLLDIDCEGNGEASQACTTVAGNSNRIPYQITQYNLMSNGSRSNYYWSHGAQMALIGSVATGMQTSIGTFINVDGNGTGAWSGSPINNINYQALMGNSLAGTGDTGTGGDEAVRVGACMLCVFSNNTFKDGNTVGAAFKLFESNNHGTGGSQTNFAGIPVQFVEISDNVFTGESGAQLAEVSPQANSFDERFYDIVIERNLFVETHDNLGNMLMLSGERETVRDNVFFIGSGFVHPSFYNVQIAERAGPNCGSACPATSQTTQHTEVYNNTGYALSFRAPQSLIAFSNAGESGNAGANSWVQNNLMYSVGSGATVVTNAGSGNTVSNNSTNTSANPNILDATGSHSVITDFQPTANYTGGEKVPVMTDALNDAWAPTWDLGAVHH